MKTIAVYDPTQSDSQSKVRGIGRYLQTLHEAFQAKSSNPPPGFDQLYFNFTTDLKVLRPDMTLLNCFFNPIAKPLIAKRYTQKQIAVIHDVIPLKYKSMFPTGLRGMWYRFLSRRALKTYDHIVTDSMASKADIQTFLKVPDHKITVIYPSAARMFSPHLDMSEESPLHHHPFHEVDEHSKPEFTELPSKIITPNELIQNVKGYAIYVGDATWNKNLPSLARAIKMTNIPCVFVGNVFTASNLAQISQKPNPWQRPLVEFLALAKNDNRFIFPGFVSDAELQLLYKHATINVLVSFDEGFGYSFIEAGYMSTPSVLSDIPVFHEIAHDAGYFANPHDPKDIAEKMTELFFDTVRHEKYSIRAFDRAQEFNPTQFQLKWVQLLNLA